MPEGITILIGLQFAGEITASADLLARFRSPGLSDRPLPVKALACERRG